MRRKKSINIPTLPMDKYLFAHSSGRKSAAILDPSRGGIGNKLKIPRSRLSCTTMRSIAKINGS